MPQQNSDARHQKTEHLIKMLEQASRHLRSGVPETWPDVEMTIPQLRTLAVLASGPFRMSDIADHVGSSYSAATAMIDRMVEKGLVERMHSTTDRRVVTCTLSPLGRKTLDEIWGVQRDGMRTVAGVLTDDELDVVVRAMEILAASAERITPSKPAER